MEKIAAPWGQSHHRENFAAGIWLGMIGMASWRMSGTDFRVWAGYNQLYADSYARLAKHRGHGVASSLAAAYQGRLAAITDRRAGE